MNKIITVERQRELGAKYGVPQETMDILQGEVEGEKREEAVGLYVTTLVNALIGLEVDPEDVEDVSSLVPDRFSITLEQYLAFL